MSYIKSFAKDWLPPAIFRALKNSRLCGIRFLGDYATWDEATAQCTGYDADPILARVLEATLKVKRGEAAYERDSVLFDEIEYAWPVTAGLMWAAAQCGGRLDVLDFGGSLGSSYFQNRSFLTDLPQVRWSVVEQAHYVEAGHRCIQDETLRFYETVESSILERQPNVVLLSSVLQYLQEPKAILNILLDLDADFLIIDRTPFLNSRSSTIIKVQSIPSSIYLASYPCWFFEEADIIECIETASYRKVVTFDSFDKLSKLATWRGFIFKKVTCK